jgi:hypothetical protein
MWLSLGARVGLLPIARWVQADGVVQLALAASNVLNKVKDQQQRRSKTCMEM